MNHLGTRELHSERLVLRRFKATDAKSVSGSYLNDPGFLYYANKTPTNLQQEEAFLNGIAQRYRSDECYNWLITLKDGTVIGAINLRVDDDGDSLEFNYAIDGRHQNNGYMTEALGTVKAFALDKLEARRFFGGCAVENTASRRVMEKCGLEYEGVLSKHLLLQDGYHDMAVYSCTNAGCPKSAGAHQ